jgi:hypothetical protein
MAWNKDTLQSFINDFFFFHFGLNRCMLSITMGKRKFTKRVKKTIKSKPVLQPLEFPVGSQEWVKMKNKEASDAKDLKFIKKNQ